MSDELSPHQLALKVAENIKKQFNFGTEKCPEWFISVSIGMEQDKTYRVDICVPSQSSVDEEVKNGISNGSKKVAIGFRSITKDSYVREDKAIVERVRPLYMVECRWHVPDMNDPHFVSSKIVYHYKTIEEAQRWCEEVGSKQIKDKNKWNWFVIHEDPLAPPAPMILKAIYDWNGKEIKEEPIKKCPK